MSRPVSVPVPPALDLPRVLDAPVSVATRGGGLIHTMGFVAVDDRGALDPGPIEHETRRALEGLRAVLAHAGASFADVVKANVFLADLDRDFAGMNQTYAEFFSAPYPARRTVQAAIVHGLKVEIEVIALDPNSD